MGCEVFHALKKVLKDKGLATAVGDEGGFAPKLESAEAALDTIAVAVKSAGYKLGKDISARPRRRRLRVLYVKEKKSYVFKKSDGPGPQRRRDGRVLPGTRREISRSSRSRTAAPKTTGTPGKNSPTPSATVQLVGDDLFVTNTEFLKRGIDSGTANSILVKVNQIGSLTETLDAVEMAKEADYTAVISHRSGETEDVTIADIAVATNAGQIKTGSLCRTDRVAKYNQLLRIEEELGASAIYGGKM